MTDIILASNKTSQLLNSIQETELADLSYSMNASYPLTAKQIVSVGTESGPVSGSSIAGPEVTFKITRSQLLRNMAMRVSFNTTSASVAITAPIGLSIVQWVQLKSNNKVLMTLTDSALRAKVDSLPTEQKLRVYRNALPLATADGQPTSTSTSTVYTYVPIFSCFFDQVINQLDLSFYEQLSITVKFNELARMEISSSVTAMNASQALLFVWTALYDEKYMSVLRARNQQPNRPLSMLGWNSTTERLTCTSTTTTPIRLNVNAPVFKTIVSLIRADKSATTSTAFSYKINSFNLDVGGVTLLSSLPNEIGQYEPSCLGQSAVIPVYGDTDLAFPYVAYDDKKSLCIEWGQLGNDAWTTCGGACSFGNINYPQLTINYTALDAGDYGKFEVQVVHFYYQILTMSSASGEVLVSVRN